MVNFSTMKIFLDDSKCKSELLPFSSTRHVSDFNIGLISIKEKWQHFLGNTATIINEPEPHSDFVSIEANIIPESSNFKLIIESCKNKTVLDQNIPIKKIKYPWDMISWNDWAIRDDFKLLTINKTSASINPNNKTINPDQIFIEEGAVINFSFLNASAGPIYIGKNSEIMEGAMIRGPFACREKSIIKMGAKIYGATTIGKNSVVGGEIKHSIISDNSNKSHDGYIGDSIIGSWCNIGAGSSNSNVKNNAEDVFYTLVNGEKVNAGKKAGLIMGDYSKCAINTRFNTGTIVGTCCNIFEDSFSIKNFPDFTWGKEKYDLQKALRDIDNWKKFKNQHISSTEIDVLTKLHQSQN